MVFCGAGTRQHVSNYFRVCHRCRIPGWFGIDVFCPQCWERLFKKWVPQNVVKPSSLPFPVHFLFQWTDESDEFVRPLIYALKQGRAPDGFRILAEELSLRRSEAGFKMPPETFLVPAPRRTERPDHAYIWAESLAAYLGLRVDDCLAFAGERAALQKTKDIETRSEIEFLHKTQTLRNSKQDSFIFVDDVVTTGATATAAWRALGYPERFEAWAITYRPRLEKKRSF